LTRNRRSPYGIGSRIRSGPQVAPEIRKPVRQVRTGRTANVTANQVRERPKRDPQTKFTQVRTPISDPVRCELGPTPSGCELEVRSPNAQVRTVDGEPRGQVYTTSGMPLYPEPPTNGLRDVLVEIRSLQRIYDLLAVTQRTSVHIRIDRERALHAVDLDHHRRRAFFDEHRDNGLLQLVKPLLRGLQLGIESFLRVSRDTNSLGGSRFITGLSFSFLV